MHQMDFVEISTHQTRTKTTLFIYINCSIMHQKDLMKKECTKIWKYRICYKHIHYNCFPNYNLDGSIQDEKNTSTFFSVSYYQTPWNTNEKNIGLHWNTTEKNLSMQPVLKHHL